MAWARTSSDVEEMLAQTAQTELMMLDDELRRLGDDRRV